MNGEERGTIPWGFGLRESGGRLSKDIGKRLGQMWDSSDLKLTQQFALPHLNHKFLCNWYCITWWTFSSSKIVKNPSKIPRIFIFPQQIPKIWIKWSKRGPFWWHVPPYPGWYQSVSCPFSPVPQMPVSVGESNMSLSEIDHHRDHHLSTIVVVFPLTNENKVSA